MNEIKELMVHVEKAVRPLRITQGRRGKIREELLSHLCDVYEQELELCGDRERAIQATIRRFGPADEISCQLRSTLPWYSATLSCIPWFARAESWPESTLRIAWRGWMTGILLWVLVGIPWCYFLFATEQSTAGRLAALWFLLATYILAFLTPIILFATSYTGGMTRLIRRDQERSERTGQWELLVLDE